MPAVVEKRMRVLLLPPMAWQPYRDGYRSGTGPNPFEIYERLADRGIDTTMIDPYPRPLNPFAGRNTLLESLDPLRALRVLVRERRVDLILSVFEGAAAPIILLRHLFGYRVPVVLWDIGLTESWALRQRVLNFVVPRADAILALSASQKPYIERRWGGGAAVHVVGHHVDTEFFSPRASCPHGPILSVGDDIGRDFDGLIAAVDGIDAEIVLKTRQPVAIPPAQRGKVRIIRDRISYVALRDLYAGSRFVVASLHDTLNANGVSTILEAGAMGKALIVSDSAAIRDFVEPGETCLLVPCGDRAAMRAAIRRLIAEPETCERLGRNARRFVEATCSRGVFADRLGHLLRRVAMPVGRRVGKA